MQLNSIEKIIFESILKIEKYYNAEEKLPHAKIVLSSDLNTTDVAGLMKSLETQFKHIDFVYLRNEEAKERCRTNQEELIIIIDEKLFTGDPGTFRIQFQSGLANVFGYLDVVLYMSNNEIAHKYQEWIVTSIGRD